MSGISVLVVEDNAANMELATDLLEAAGFVVLQAVNAECAIEMARDKKPALILMDVGLPGMDGLAATRLLQNDEQTQDIPVVVVTAHAMKGDQEKALQSGCVGYITKPIDTRSFIAQVASFLNAP